MKISGQFEWTEDMLQAGPNLGRQGAIATKVGSWRQISLGSKNVTCFMSHIWCL